MKTISYSLDPCLSGQHYSVEVFAPRRTLLETLTEPSNSKWDWRALEVMALALCTSGRMHPDVSLVAYSDGFVARVSDASWWSGIDVVYNFFPKGDRLSKEVSFAESAFPLSMGFIRSEDSHYGRPPQSPSETCDSDGMYVASSSRSNRFLEIEVAVGVTVGSWPTDCLRLGPTSVWLWSTSLWSRMASENRPVIDESLRRWGPLRFGTDYDIANLPHRHLVSIDKAKAIASSAPRR